MHISFVIYIYVQFFVLGERLTDVEVETILKATDTEEDLDGNIKYESKRTWVMECAEKYISAEDFTFSLAVSHEYDH